MQLQYIWDGKPCHVAKAKIGNIVIHHGSFHSLKGKEFINDEVRIAIATYILLTMVVRS